MKIADGFTGQRFLAIPLYHVEQMERNPLTRPLYIFAIGHFSKARHHYVERLAGCQEFVLLYCTEGGGWVEIGAEKHRLHAGQFIVIPKAETHRYYCDEEEPWTIYWVHFRGEAAAHVAEGLDRSVAVSVADDSRIDERNRLFDEIYNALDGNPTPQALEYANMLFMHYVASLRHLAIYRASRPLEPTTIHSDTIVRKAMHYMSEHVESRLTIGQLSAFCGYSPSYLYRKFVKEAGMAPIDYFNRLKVNRACFLLLHTNMSISQIALKLAFSESQYFARTFRKIMGMSATDYRKSY